MENRQRGSHLILKHASRPMLIVPVHRGDIPRGLFLRVLKDSGFSEDDFLGTEKRKRSDPSAKD